jgi:hypothetical protein
MGFYGSPKGIWAFAAGPAVKGGEKARTKACSRVMLLGSVRLSAGRALVGPGRELVDVCRVGPTERVADRQGACDTVRIDASSAPSSEFLPRQQWFRPQSEDKESGWAHGGRPRAVHEQGEGQSSFESERPAQPPRYYSVFRGLRDRRQHGRSP